MATTFKSIRLPSIPQPDGSDASTLAVLMALKQAVEWLLGSRDTVPTHRIFVQDATPVARTEGDLWITSQPTSTLSYWTGTAWQPFAVAHPDGTLHSS